MALVTKKRSAALILALGAFLLAGSPQHPARALAADEPRAVPAASPDTSAHKNLTPVVLDTTGDARALAELRESIAGHEEEPASKVFKNIKLFNDMPAGQLPRVMGGWTRVIGVGCAHCHTPGHWAEDAKPPKQIAREMAQMTGEINNGLLAKIQNLRSDEPHVSCGTCHRGQPKPETQWPPRDAARPPGAPDAGKR